MTTQANRCKPKDSTETCTVVDVKLFETIGLYKILRPMERRMRSTVRALCWLVIGLQAVQCVRLFRSFDDAALIVLEIMFMVNGLLCMYKGIVMTGRANDVLTVLDVAGFKFTSCGLRLPAELHRCRATLYVWLRPFVALAYFTVGLWILLPWFMESAVLSVDWVVGYAILSISLPIDVFCGMGFDCFLITSCLALEAQFRTVSKACATVGHHPESSSGVETLGSSGDSRIYAHHTRLDDDYNELVRYIVDMQKIMKKLDDLFAIVRPVVQLQIASGFFSVTTLVFFTLHIYLMGGSIMSATVLKLFLSLLTVIFQLYLYCYTLNLVETAKSTLNFGLYSSNWTEMDLKFKKTIMLTMYINYAHIQVINIAPELIVNLELFEKVVIFSYKIVSVFIKQ